MPDNAYVFDVEAEKAVLAACFLSEDTKEIVSSVESEGFHREAHAVIFEAMRFIVSGGKPLDHVIFAPKLDARGMLGSPISRLDLLNLCDTKLSLVAWPMHMKIVCECSIPAQEDGHHQRLFGGEPAQPAVRVHRSARRS